VYEIVYEEEEWGKKDVYDFSGMTLKRMKKKQNALVGHRTVKRYEGKNTALIFIKTTTHSVEKKFVEKKSRPFS